MTMSLPWIPTIFGQAKQFDRGSTITQLFHGPGLLFSTRLSGFDHSSKVLQRDDRHAIRVAHHDIARGHGHSAEQHRLADGRGGLLDRSTHGDAPGKSRKLHALQGIDIAYATI